MSFGGKNYEGKETKGENLKESAEKGKGKGTQRGEKEKMGSKMVK